MNAAHAHTVNAGHAHTVSAGHAHALWDQTGLDEFGESRWSDHGHAAPGAGIEGAGGAGILKVTRRAPVAVLCFAQPFLCRDAGSPSREACFSSCQSPQSFQISIVKRAGLHSAWSESKAECLHLVKRWSAQGGARTPSHHRHATAVCVTLHLPTIHGMRPTVRPTIKPFLMANGCPLLQGISW